MNPIKIFGFAGSTYVRTARAICVEKGIPTRSYLSSSGPSRIVHIIRS